ncbi:MAG TPA: hypothetical protein DCF48_02130 [Rikenellaceae bacterium]|nr:hypothetical protein [Rikenellaceae bacterium]
MKKMIFATLVAVMGLYSCSKTELANTSNPLPMPENVAAKVQGLEITPKTNYVVVGEEVSLTAAFKPEDAQAGTITWKSSDETVATVDAGGKVTTLAKGVASITASVDGVSASALVNVFAERVPATEIVLNKTEVSLLVGRAANIKSSLLPENTTDARKLEWTSSDEKVAVVSYGYIQAVGMGEATITARQDDLTATVKVTVADKIKLVDRAEAWTVTDTPKWDKDYYGTITGSHEEVSVAGFDGEYAYFGIVEASKFEGVEAISNAVYEQVTEKQDAGQSPEGLFRKEEQFSANYSEKGEAVAYLLAYDEEFEFTGEYVVYNFTAREPDPVHATGIEFQGQSGWDYAAISSLQLKEGKSTRLKLKLLPDDCTDTGSITLAPKDPSMMKVEAYYPQWYPNQFTVTALAEGTTKLVATFNDVVSELDVTITGTNITLTDHSATWAATKEVTEQWGYTIVNITVTACDAASFYATATDEKPQGTTLKSTLAAMADAAASYEIQSEVPATFQSWGGPDGRYIVILGYNGEDFSGDYAIIDTEGGTTPTPDPGTGGVSVSFDAQGQYLQNTFGDSDAVQDEVTLEGWFKPSSLTGGGDNIRVLWGTEGIFLLRYEGSQLNLVYGGAKRTDKNEYNERKVTYTTNMAVNEWHHIAATYKRNEKARLYVDGVEVASNDAEDHAIELNGVGAKWDLPFSFIIGAAGQPKRNFLGSMAYLRVWNVARTATEIAANMNVASPDDDNSNLLAAWNFTEGSGNNIADSAYGVYPLTANSNLSWSSDALPF